MPPPQPHHRSVRSLRLLGSILIGALLLAMPALGALAELAACQDCFEPSAESGCCSTGASQGACVERCGTCYEDAVSTDFVVPSGTEALTDGSTANLAPIADAPSLNRSSTAAAPQAGFLARHITTTVILT